MRFFRRLLDVFILGGYLVSPAYADTINFTQVQPLTFPTLALPVAGETKSLSISALNSSTSGNAQIIGGTAWRGEYSLSMNKKGNAIAISIDVTDINTGNAWLMLHNFTGLYSSMNISSFPSSTLPLPDGKPATTPLYLGATVTANSGLTPGQYTASFSITIFVL